MFILTIGNDDPKVIGKILRELAIQIERQRPNGCLGVTDDEMIDYEYDFSPDQPFVCMARFLYFTETGNKLLEHD